MHPDSGVPRLTPNKMPSRGGMPSQDGKPLFDADRQGSLRQKRILLPTTNQKPPRNNKNGGAIGRATLIIIVIAFLLMGGVIAYLLVRNPEDDKGSHMDTTIMEDSKINSEVLRADSPTITSIPLAQAARVGKLSATVKPVMHLAP